MAKFNLDEARFILATCQDPLNKALELLKQKEQEIEALQQKVEKANKSYQYSSEARQGWLDEFDSLRKRIKELEAEVERLSK